MQDIETLSAKRCERVSYEENPEGFGFLTKYSDQVKQVPRTPENAHFFHFIKLGSVEAEGEAEDKGYFVLDYNGSGDVVGRLELDDAINKQFADKSEQRIPLSFFDIRGNFHHAVHLHGLYPNRDLNGSSGTKHTAVFEPTTPEGGEPFAIAIDSIYCLYLAKINTET